MGDVMEWREIGTAPKDGTKIDLWAIGAEGEAERIPDVVWDRRRFFSFSEGETKEYDGWVCLCGDGFALVEWELKYTPTHWMPLPTPPSPSRSTI